MAASEQSESEISTFLSHHAPLLRDRDHGHDSAHVVLAKLGLSRASRARRWGFRAEFRPLWNFDVGSGNDYCWAPGLGWLFWVGLGTSGVDFGLTPDA